MFLWHRIDKVKTTVLLGLASFIYFSVRSGYFSSVRVCPTFPDYDWFFSRNCYDNPVVNQNISEIIRSWGFSAEEHYVTTQDGYKLLLERAYSTITRTSPIIIVHGIAMSSLGFVNRGNKSLAYLLGKEGYDVWLLNYRGTWYSKGHVNLTTSDNDYWKFSVNELGIYDIRSAVKLVNEKTNRKATYVGYSMGATGFLIYSITFPGEARTYLNGMIGLAPVINYKGTRSIAKLSSTWWPLVKPLVYKYSHGEILPGFSVLLRPLVKFSLGMYLIQTGVNLLFGDDYAQMDALTYPQFITQLVDTTGAETYTHYLQIYGSGVFQNYDYGRLINMERYGRSQPPPYNLSTVSVPVALFLGRNDWLATPENARQLYSELPASSRCGFHFVKFRKWNHVDFLVAKDIREYLYRHVFNKIEEINSGQCHA